MANPAAFWMHPVPRRLDDPLRRALRERCGHYRIAPPAPDPAPSEGTEGLLATMRAIPGWLADAEARALLDCARAAPAGGHIVEVGSHCGKATFLLGHAARETAGRVTAIDRFDGVSGSREDRLTREAATRIRFDRLVSDSGLADWVFARTGEASEVATADPVDFLLIDGLHDYPAVAADFAAFEAALTPAARVGFHDYADYFPGVMAFVDELVAGGDWDVETAVETLRILRRVCKPPAAAEQLMEAQA
jgi:hypothetical protein